MEILGAILLIILVIFLIILFAPGILVYIILPAYGGYLLACHIADQNNWQDRY